jgi:chromosome partitioning protein
MIVMVGNEKGGCGKTTLATNLAVLRAQAGRDVLLVDADSSQWATMWADIRSELGTAQEITVVQLQGKGLGAEVRKLAAKFQDIVIDTGAHNTPEFRASLLVADAFVCPATPNQFDLTGVERSSELVGDVDDLNPGLRAFTLINEADTVPNSRGNRGVAEILGQIENMTFLGPIYRRAAFRRSTEEGLAVNELRVKDRKAIEEMSRLYQEVFSCEA